jgi:hypothetical protein
MAWNSSRSSPSGSLSRIRKYGGFWRGSAFFGVNPGWNPPKKGIPSLKLRSSAYTADAGGSAFYGVNPGMNPAKKRHPLSEFAVLAILERGTRGEDLIQI